MTFEEHIQATLRADGSADLAAAQKARAEELRSDDDALAGLADKAARDERRAWESTNRQRLVDQFKRRQQVLDLGDLDMHVMVPLGDNTAVELGDMSRLRIRIRKELRTRKHIDENRAFDAEISFWGGIEALLPPDDEGQTIRELARS